MARHVSEKFSEEFFDTPILVSEEMIRRAVRPGRYLPKFSIESSKIEKSERCRRINNMIGFFDYTAE